MDTGHAIDESVGPSKTKEVYAGEYSTECNVELTVVKDVVFEVDIYVV